MGSTFSFSIISKWYDNTNWVCNSNEEPLAIPIKLINSPSVFLPALLQYWMVLKLHFFSFDLLVRIFIHLEMWQLTYIHQLQYSLIFVKF